MRLGTSARTSEMQADRMRSRRKGFMTATIEPDTKSKR
jgi:hypothetical protein